MSQEVMHLLSAERGTILARWQARVADLVTTDKCGGITASNWTTIFEPFARGDDGVVRQREGLGLGLAIAKQTAEAHGGSLSVRNLETDGCVFELRIPCVAPPVSAGN